MYKIDGIGLETVKAVYSGPERQLWELVMGEQIHLGGLQSSLALAAAANIPRHSHGIDLCCCTGAGMRFLLHFLDVAHMTGVDTTPEVIEEGRRRSVAMHLKDRITFVLADACATTLDEASADFVWGEDAWCYVENKDALICEAARLVKPGGTIAFTDWVAGSVAMSVPEAERFLSFMKFSNMLTREEYAGRLQHHGMEVVRAEDTRRFAPCLDLYLQVIEQQLAYDVQRILGFDDDLVEAVATEMKFAQELAHADKLAQGMFVARKPGK